MEKIAFRMQLKPGHAEEYKRRHDAIWPELVAFLKGAGISDYSIFLDDETHMLFGVLRCTDAQSLDDLGREPVMRGWWSCMAALMETEPDLAPRVWPLRNVFHLE